MITTLSLEKRRIIPENTGTVGKMWRWRESEQQERKTQWRPDLERFCGETTCRGQWKSRMEKEAEEDTVMQRPLQGQPTVCDLFPLPLFILCIQRGLRMEERLEPAPGLEACGAALEQYRATESGFIVEKGFLKKSESSSGINSSFLNHVLLT